MPGTRKLGRTTDHRLAMLKSLTTSLLLNGRIETTEAKAKEVKPIVEKLITLAIKEQSNVTTAEKTVSHVNRRHQNHAGFRGGWVQRRR